MIRVLNPYFLICTAPMRKNTLKIGINSGAERTVFFMDKISFTFKLFSDHFIDNLLLRLSQVLRLFTYRTNGLKY